MSKRTKKQVKSAVFYFAWNPSKLQGGMNCYESILLRDATGFAEKLHVGFIRGEIVSGNALEALDQAELLNGETVLNAVEVEE